MSAENDASSDPDPWCAGDVHEEIRQLAIQSLRWQAQEIINDVLSRHKPGEELARARLRRCLARNPGRPERALLEHLRASGDSLSL